MIKSVAILILFILFAFSAHSQALKTMSIEFVRSITHDVEVEITKGNIYYDSKATTLIINAPINQWMILKGNNILIYYPDEDQAVQMKSNNPMNLPFFHALIAIFKEDFGLNELGFTLNRSETIKDTLFTHWNPSENLKKIMGQFSLALAKNRLIFTENRDPSGKLVVKTEFRDYTVVGKVAIPLRITTVRNLENHSSSEEVIFSNPVLNEPLPPEIVNFRIEGEKIKEISW